MYIIIKTNLVKKEEKMLYGIEEEKINKGKKHIRIDRIALISICIAFIALCLYMGKYCAEKATIYQYTQQITAQAQVIEEQAQIKNQEEEARRKKGNQPLTQEQIQAVNQIYHSEQRRVFLTFDDGPSQAVTPFILDLLKQENIKASFFVLGDRVVANPDLVKRAYEEGHFIANHGKTHIYQEIYSSPEKVIEEYNNTNQAIRNAIGNPEYHSRVFRFPGGSKGGYYSEIKSQALQLLNQNGIASLDWNCLSKDAEGAKTKEQLIQNVITTMGTKQSVVILMHDASNKILTYEALPEIIQYLRQNGYVFCSLQDILDIQSQNEA